MQLGPDNAAAAVERHPCPQCEVPAGSACRTRAGKTAAKYHTARFILVPALRDGLTVPVPADRGPGRKWTQGPEVTAALPETTGTPIRVGYARCSTSTQELQSQLDALAAAHCTRVFSEKISTRIKIRPELEKAVILAHEIKAAAPGQPVILAVHEMKRLARNAAELMTLSARLQGGGVQLELLSGPLTGVYDPHGMGSMLFAVLGVACEKVKYPTLRFCGAMACGCRGCGAGPDSRPSSLGNAIPWSSRWLTGTLFGCDTESVPALPLIGWILFISIGAPGFSGASPCLERALLMIGFRRGSGPSFSRWAAGLGAAALVAGGLALATPSTPAGKAPEPLAASQTTPESLALAQARRTGSKTRVDALTTETRVVDANPDGTFTQTVSAVQVRMRQGSGWADLDLTLADDGTGVRPKMAPMDVSFGRGGDSRMSTVGDGKGHSILQRWPYGNLPAPVLAGSQATYPDVLPGVDLVLVSARDRVGQVFKVKTAAALADPRLKELRVSLQPSGASVASDGDGGVAVKGADTGQVVLATSKGAW